MDEQTPWEYKPGATATAEKPAFSVSASTASGAGPAKPPPDTITWTASEYIDHSRGANWYFLLAISTGVLAALVYLLTKDYFATGTIVVLGVIVGTFAMRKPRQITYELSSIGLKVGDKLYELKAFKSFSVFKEGSLSSINLLPLRRFMPPVSAFYESADEEKILDILGSRLPYEEHKLDQIERLSRRLRF